MCKSNIQRFNKKKSIGLKQPFIEYQKELRRFGSSISQYQFEIKCKASHLGTCKNCT